jgi:hypothetical protein
MGNSTSNTESSTSNNERGKRKEEDPVNDSDSEESEEEGVVSKSTKRTKVGGKLLVKNCRVWQWENEGVFNGPNYSGGIQGKASSLSWMSVQSNGIISTISSETPPPSDSLFDCIMDVEGALVLPGLIDSHIHVMMTGESSYHLNLQHCKSIAQLQQMLKAHAEKYPELPWVIGEKWDQVLPSLLHIILYSLNTITINLDPSISLSYPRRPRCGCAQQTCLFMAGMLAYRSSEYMCYCMCWS